MNSIQPRRRLSLWRLTIAILVLVGISYGSFLGWQSFQGAMAADNVKPWFGPYVDVTATPQFDFEQLAKVQGERNLILSFIVSSKTSPCLPSWGGVYSLDEAGLKLDLDRRIARFRQREGNIAISFGGALNDELSVNCKDDESLTSAYLSVIDRYNLDTIDLDIEGEDLKNSQALDRRFSVISKIQQKLRSENRKLAVWLTLPVTTSGLSEDGTNAVSSALTSGVDLSGVNAMTMDFGNSKNESQSMSDASTNALKEMHRQIGILYNKAGIDLSDNSLWTKIGATVMIGQNDTSGEVFSLEDATSFNKFAASVGVRRLSIWSANRDIECGENYVNVNVVSDSCSGIKQEKFGFANILNKSFDGKISQSASAVTTSDPKKEMLPDNPSTSPYQVWEEAGVYLQGTKVVWHHNVYEAKWWTKGDLPDNPVLQAWQTPWQLIGPVLPGEKPVPQPTLPEGTYPTWSGTKTYDAGQIILFNGVPYQAKWWTQGDSPAASTSNPDSSPWVILKQEQVDEIIKKS